MKTQNIIITFAALAFAIGCKKSTSLPVTEVNEELQSLPMQTRLGSYVSNEILVKFKTAINTEEKNKALQKVGGIIKENIFTKAMQKVGHKEGIYLIHTPLEVLQAVDVLKNSISVEYAEPNYIYQHCATSNDPYFVGGNLWGMYGDASSPANQYGSQAAEAWATGNTGSPDVYVGIIDEGYFYLHPDFNGNVGTNTGEVANNKKDDDGNGYVDDVYGWDFAGNNKTIFDGVGDDHGTHVAGTIGAVGGNGIGVAGVCWQVKLLNAKFLGSSGGTTANAIKAVDYFTNLKNAGLNIVATNNSWGGGGFSTGLYDAISRANTAGILFIAAAGNNGTNNDAVASYPANYALPNVIAVAALSANGTMPSWSQYGANTVHIGAPGDAIYSTVPKSNKGKIVASYASYSGTSMATPHVSGAAALYAASHSGATAATIKAAILNAAIYTAALNGKCTSNGRLDCSGF